MTSDTSAVTEGEILSHAIESIGQPEWHQVADVFSMDAPLQEALRARNPKHEIRNKREKNSNFGSPALN